MAVVLGSIYHGYNWLFYEIADPRNANLLFMGSPLVPFGVIGLYLFFVLSLGPSLMADRPPFKLKNTLAIFNIFQIAASWWFFYQCLDLAWAGKYKLVCEPVDFSNDKGAVDVAYTTWMYMLLKFVDFFDTIFIVLKKNQRQVTFLHVYHHAGVAVVLWGAAKYFPGGHGTSLGLINSFVHGIMYSYYLLTTVAPSYKKNIWWKKYITQMQMVQFVMLFLHSLSVLMVPNCEYQPKYLYAGLMVPQNMFMFILFYNFYRTAYSEDKMAKASAASAVQNGKKTS